MTIVASEETRKNWNVRIVLAAVLVLAAALRLVGLRWGLPNELHAYSYHPDEFLTVGAASSVYLARSFDPRLYNYPSLYLYISALAIAVGFGYGVIGGPDGIYLAARVVTVLMGVGAVAATYWAGREMLGKAVGLLAALILAIAPLHVQHSHFATVDVPSTLFVAAALGYAALVMRRGDWRDYILAGVMVGLAAGTKYNAAVVVLSVIAAHFMRAKVNWSSIRSAKLWASLGCVVAAFVISTPGSVLRTTAFLHGLTYEMKHASTGHGLVFAGTGNGFVYTFVSSLQYGLGPLLAALFVMSVVWALVTRNKFALMILAFVLPYYTLISVSQVRFARYTLPMYPAIAILCGWLMCDLWERLAKRRLLPVVGRYMWALFCLGALLMTLFTSLMLDSLFDLTDPREQAARWVFGHASKGSSIGMMDLPWFYSPPLSKEFGFGTTVQREEAIKSTPYNIVVFSQSEKPGDWWNEKNAPEWVIISEYEIRDALRLKDDKHLTREQRAEVDLILANLSAIQDNYTQRKTFGGMWYAFRRFPHDMRYVFPKITIYEREK